MSAPQTNVEKQAKQHKGPMVGISLALVFAAVLLFLFMAFVVDRGGEPEGAETQIDARTGDEVPAEGD